MTSEQQQAFIKTYVKEVTDETAKITMEWDTDLTSWHFWAILALKFASPASLKFPQERFSELFERAEKGLNLNIVSILCHNLESMSLSMLDVDRDIYLDVLKLNQVILSRWRDLAKPVEEIVRKRFELMGIGSAFAKGGNLAKA